MFLACYLQASIFTRQRCCSQSRPTTNSTHDCYVMRNEALYAAALPATRIASITIRHAHLQHLFYFMLNVRTA